MTEKEGKLRRYQVVRIRLWSDAAAGFEPGSSAWEIDGRFDSSKCECPLLLRYQSFVGAGNVAVLLAHLTSLTHQLNW